MLENAYNIYCDESRVDNADARRMVIGALIIPRNKKKRIENGLKRVYAKHGFSYELKWTKVRDKYWDLYSDLMRYFLSMEDLLFRCIVVDKSKFDLEKFHEGDPELAFYKFYYLMLRPTLSAGGKYYILLDKKPTSKQSRTVALHEFLQRHASGIAGCTIQHFQSYDSRSNTLIQLTDFLTGLIGFDVNEERVNEGREDSAKGRVSREMKEMFQRTSFKTSSVLQEKKLNIFVWEPRS